MGLPALLVGWCCGSCAVGLDELGIEYLRYRPGMLYKISSHMWGSWYLTVSLLRDGSLTLMNLALLDGPGDGVGLPPNYGESFQFVEVCLRCWHGH